MPYISLLFSHLALSGVLQMHREYCHVPLGRSKGKATARDSPIYQGDHSAQGHVPKSVSCQKMKIYSKQTQDHLLAQPLAQGTGAVPAQEFRKDVKNEKPLCFKKGYYDCKVCPCFTKIRLSTSPVLPKKGRTSLKDTFWTHRFAFPSQAQKQLTDRFMQTICPKGELTEY